MDWRNRYNLRSRIASERQAKDRERRLGGSSVEPQTEERNRNHERRPRSTNPVQMGMPEERFEEFEQMKTNGEWKEKRSNINKTIDYARTDNSEVEGEALYSSREAKVTSFRRATRDGLMSCSVTQSNSEYEKSSVGPCSQSSGNYDTLHRTNANNLIYQKADECHELSKLHDQNRRTDDIVDVSTTALENLRNDRPNLHQSGRGRQWISDCGMPGNNASCLARQSLAKIVPDVNVQSINLQNREILLGSVYDRRIQHVKLNQCDEVSVSFPDCTFGRDRHSAGGERISQREDDKCTQLSCGVDDVFLTKILTRRESGYGFILTFEKKSEEDSKVDPLPVFESLTSGGAAEDAGIRPGDRLLEVNCKSVSGLSPFFCRKLFENHDEVTLKLIRSSADARLRRGGKVDAGGDQNNERRKWKLSYNDVEVDVHRNGKELDAAVSSRWKHLGRPESASDSQGTIPYLQSKSRESLLNKNRLSIGTNGIKQPDKDAERGTSIHADISRASHSYEANDENFKEKIKRQEAADSEKDGRDKNAMDTTAMRKRSRKRLGIGIKERNENNNRSNDGRQRQYEKEMPVLDIAGVLRNSRDMKKEANCGHSLKDCSLEKRKPGEKHYSSRINPDKRSAGDSSAKDDGVEVDAQKDNQRKSKKEESSQDETEPLKISNKEDLSIQRETRHCEMTVHKSRLNDLNECQCCDMESAAVRVREPSGFHKEPSAEVASVSATEEGSEGIVSADASVFHAPGSLQLSAPVTDTSSGIDQRSSSEPPLRKKNRHKPPLGVLETPKVISNANVPAAFSSDANKSNCEATEAVMVIMPPPSLFSDDVSASFEILTAPKTSGMKDKKPPVSLKPFRWQQELKPSTIKDQKKPQVQVQNETEPNQSASEGTRIRLEMKEESGKKILKGCPSAGKENKDAFQEKFISKVDKSGKDYINRKKHFVVLESRSEIPKDAEHEKRSPTDSYSGESVFPPAPPGFCDSIDNLDEKILLDDKEKQNGSLNTGGIESKNLTKTPTGQMLTSAVTNWTALDVVKWLENQGLGEHREQFLRNSIDGLRLMQLNRQSLISLGMTTTHHRMHFERALLRQQNSAIFY